MSYIDEAAWDEMSRQENDPHIIDAQHTPELEPIGRCSECDCEVLRGDPFVVEGKELYCEDCFTLPDEDEE